MADTARISSPLECVLAGLEQRRRVRAGVGEEAADGGGDVAQEDRPVAVRRVEREPGAGRLGGLEPVADQAALAVAGGRRDQGQGPAHHPDRDPDDGIVVSDEHSESSGSRSPNPPRAAIARSEVAFYRGTVSDPSEVAAPRTSRPSRSRRCHAAALRSARQGAVDLAQGSVERQPPGRPVLPRPVSRSQPAAGSGAEVAVVATPGSAGGRDAELDRPGRVLRCRHGCALRPSTRRRPEVDPRPTRQDLSPAVLLPGDGRGRPQRLRLRALGR